MWLINGRVIELRYSQFKCVFGDMAIVQVDYVEGKAEELGD
jgi:hypothetical protein